MIRAASIFLVVATYAFAPVLIVSCCSVNKTGSSGTVEDKMLPAEASLAPSTFRCEARVTDVHTYSIGLVIGKITQQGAGLFYSVAAGDTISARRPATRDDYLVKDAVLEIIIEERLRMNAEIPDFIIRQAMPLRN